MARFTTRVELHEATWDDYEELYEAMEAEGFSRYIGSDGTNYHLPTAEYNYVGAVTADAVLEKAKRAAKQTGRKYSVLVTEAVMRKWVGLKRRTGI